MLKPLHWEILITVILLVNKISYKHLNDKKRRVSNLYICI